MAADSANIVLIDIFRLLVRSGVLAALFSRLQIAAMHMSAFVHQADMRPYGLREPASSQEERCFHSGAIIANDDPGGDEAVFNATSGSFWRNVKSRPPSVGGLTHFEVKTVSASLPPSEPFSIVLLKRTSAAVAMASFI